MSEKITHKLQALPPGAPYFSLEFFPPKTAAGTQNFLSRLSRLTQLTPLFVTVTWGAGGSTATKSLELAEMTQQQFGLTTCLHLTCTNMRQQVLDEALRRCREIGVRNILALRGDEPREGEYADEDEPTPAAGRKFEYAIDLVRYIRETHGDYFCIGVAAYPEGHSTSSYALKQDVAHDLPYLVEKTKAGADFIMTQLFYDVDAYIKFERLLREHESGVFKDMPIIPGLMPIQSWSTVKRVTNLSCAKIPADYLKRIEVVKADDEAVKAVGIDILTDIVNKISDSVKDGVSGRSAHQGYHFYTLNLEKAVAQILERAGLVSKRNGDVVVPVKAERKTSSASTKEQSNGTSKANALAVSEGQGSLGREATWDDFPNGRWGDTRSPAYGSIDGYGPSLHVSRAEALMLWGRPTSRDEVTSIFKSYLTGKITANPWSEEKLSAETGLIREQLLKITEKGWWTMASQPAVNAVPSSDETVGWGPKTGGWVWQKPFVEFFLPKVDWESLKMKMDSLPDEVTYFAGNARGDFASNDEHSVNTVTWGAFKDKEIISPTIIDGVSFKAWMDEAFGIWREWQMVYPVGSDSSRLLQELKTDLWLVNVIGHDYMNPNSLWNLLIEG